LIKRKIITKGHFGQAANCEENQGDEENRGECNGVHGIK
jgi:hypothetical protein